MIRSAIELIRDLTAALGTIPPSTAEERLAEKELFKRAEAFLTTVTPRWDEGTETFRAVHPEDGQEYEVHLVYVDLTEACLLAVFAEGKTGAYFVSDEFAHEWR